MKELEERPEWCLDLMFMHVMLRLGYEFKDNRDMSVKIGKKDWRYGVGMVFGSDDCYGGRRVEL